MKIINTSDPSNQPRVTMLVYGDGGVGKSTFASTAPKPIMADCEGGTKYFGLRGIKLDVAQIEKWSDIKEFVEYAKANGYETIIIDPIGELMSKLKRFMGSLKDSKLTQKDGSPSMAGWGWLKTTMRDTLKWIRDLGMHVLIVAHVDNQKDEDRVIKWPLIETKLSDELVNMMDVVGYMTVMRDAETQETKRVILVDPDSDKFKAKDRTGQLGKIIEPDFTKIVAAIQGTETYAWSKPKEPNKMDKTVETITKELGGEEVKPEAKQQAQNNLTAARAKMAAGKQEALENKQ